MPDWVAFSRSAARVNEPSSHTAITARPCRSAIPATDASLLENLMPGRRIYYFGRTRHPVRVPPHATMDVTGGDPDGSEFRHRRPRLAAARQLGPHAQVPHRAGAGDDEEAWP